MRFDPIGFMLKDDQDEATGIEIARRNWVDGPEYVVLSMTGLATTIHGTGYPTLHAAKIGALAVWRERQKAKAEA